MDARDTLDALIADPEFADRITFRKELPAALGRTAPPTEPLHPEVRERLRARRVAGLWTHQARAIDAFRDGRSVVVATGTASGKSLCYQLPIIDSVVAGRRDTALCIYPTKALAHDQLRSLRSWLVPGLQAVTYDGDTSRDDRVWARRRANVVLTNPEMLHMGILPAHGRWSDFFLRLRYVVVDELHTLRGVFGSHVAHVLRRLRRIAAHYGSTPAFCFASATIGNPAELASKLCGLPVETIGDDGAPQRARSFAIWQRPLLNDHSRARASANAETARVLTRFVADGHPTIAFTRSRRGAELVATYARDRLAKVAPDAVDRVAAYRAGYLPRERRDVEQALADGKLVGIAATNALELGIDVGALGAVVVNGFPGTLASLWQQVGRAGRGRRAAAAVLVVGDDQLDQWYATHPEELFTRRSESAVVNPQNPFVFDPQVACAAHELALTHEDEQWFGDGLDDAVRRLTLADQLKPRRGAMYFSGNDAPAPRVGLRTGSTVEYQLVTGDGTLVGTTDDARVFQVAHPGAMYLHRGQQWRVDRLDLDGHEATLVPANDLDEYTQPRTDIDISTLGEDRSVSIGAGRAHLGAVEVTHRVVGYQRKRVSTNEVIETVALDLPPRTLPTRACWYTISAGILAEAGVDTARALGAAHAAEHGLIGLLPLFLICDRWDVGGVSMAEHPATGEPTIFVYDGFAGGAGIAELAFERVDELVAATYDLVAACPCELGCPSCVQSPKCGNWNESLDKAGAVALLGALVRPSSRC